MANHVSALKRARQTETRTEVNRANRSRVRSSLRALREALTKGDATAAQAQYRATVSSARQERAEGRSPLEHRFPLQEPFERAPEDAGHHWRRSQDQEESSLSA
jgi:small subunit ribosomal protein S20